MYYDVLMTDEDRAIRQEVRQFVRDEVSSDFVRAMDREEIKYPREFVQKLAARNLLGLRFDKKWGGRGLKWTSEVAAEEEVGILGTALGCAFVMPSIVGEALHTFGTEEQKERFLRPILARKAYQRGGPYRTSRRVGFLRRHKPSCPGRRSILL